MKFKRVLYQELRSNPETKHKVAWMKTRFCFNIGIHQRDGSVKNYSITHIVDKQHKDIESKIQEVVQYIKEIE